MTITSSVQRQFYRSPSPNSEDLIRIPPTVIMSHNLPRSNPRGLIIKTKRRLNIWTVEEHERFLLGLEQFPNGPWKAIASVVGTKTTRQTMTHSQKYREKIKRLIARADFMCNPLTPSRNDRRGASLEAPSDPVGVSSPNVADRVDDAAIWNRDLGDLSGSMNWDSELDAFFRELELLPFDASVEV